MSKMKRKNDIGSIVVVPGDLSLVMGFSRSTGYVLENTDPTFPKRRQLTEGRVGWLRQDLEAWANSRPIASNKKSGGAA